MTWTFYRDGKPEKVEKEKWCWECVYTDGTIIKQFDDDGIFHQFKEIDQSRLFAFKMVSDTFTHTLLWEEGMKLIHYYDEYFLDVNGPNQRRITVYCFGYETAKEKRVFKIINNEIVMTNGDQKVRVG